MADRSSRRSRRTNPALGLELLQGLPPAFDSGSIAAAFFESWRELDPDAAQAGGLFRAWGRREPRAMMQWAAGQDAPTARTAFRSLLDGRDARDPTELIALAREFPDAVDENTLTNLAGGLFRLAWAGNRPLLERDATVAAVMRGWSEKRSRGGGGGAVEECLGGGRLRRRSRRPKPGPVAPGVCGGVVRAPA